VIERARELAARPGRSLLGIAGAPGAGKSTLATSIAATVPGSVVVPMDGFHLTTASLAARGLVAERGTPRTFDAAGYAALLRQLRGGDAVRAPDFDRRVEEPVPDTIEVPPSCPLVITEGNYLLLDVEPWSRVRPSLDETWFVEVPEPLRVARLVARFVEFGMDEGVARERVLHGSDAANARLVARTRSRADLVVSGVAGDTVPG
jgi:pantothenate kinase